jgi:tryptophan synthase alpha subunit
LDPFSEPVDDTIDHDVQAKFEAKVRALNNRSKLKEIVQYIPKEQKSNGDLELIAIMMYHSIVKGNYGSFILTPCH